MTIQNKSTQKIAKYLIFCIVSIICVSILNGSKIHYIWDEVYYVPLIQDVINNGLSVENCINYKGSAPGPGFQIIFGLFFKCTTLKFNIIILRLFNLAIYLSIPLSLFYHKNKLQENKIIIAYLFLLSIPFNYVFMTIGISDTLAMFFGSLSVRFFQQSKDNKHFFIGCLFALLAALCRQTLLVLYVLPLISIYNNRDLRIQRIMIVILSSLPLLFLFWQWGGLMPIDQRHTGSGGYSIKNFVTHIKYLSFVYLMVAVFFHNWKDFSSFKLNHYFKDFMLNKPVLMLLLITPLKITHSYSSKYMGALIPFVLFYELKDVELKKYHLIVVVIMASIGFYQISNYYTHSRTGLIPNY
jgi:hypothetical protein